MRKLWGNILLAIALLVVTSASNRLERVASHDWQADCIGQFVQGTEVIAHKRMDINQDGIADDIVIYGNGDLNVLVVTNQPATVCKVILNQELTSRQLLDGKQTVTVQKIEMIELTGDEQLELHIWLDKDGGGSRISKAFHAIFRLLDGTLHRIFVVEQCLAFSSFVFRDGGDNIKEIYLDEDSNCDVPFSGRREYVTYKWVAGQFELIDSGSIATHSLYPPIWYVICMLPIIIGVTFSVVVMLFLLGRRSIGRRKLPV